jgi:hypothetical protein
MVGPTCPVQREGQPCEKPAQTAEVQATRTGSNVVVASTTTGSDGSYQLDLPPGGYELSAKAGRSCNPVTITVERGRMSQVDITCDTGMR